MMKITEIESQQACNKLKRKIPYQWDLNIYRGCQHGCVYCYAMYTHDHLHSSDFFQDIYVKKNIVELLEKQLSSSLWKRDIINIGGVTDSYQPIEEKYQLMPQILKLLIKYRTPCIISTKSDLILRDYDLIDELSKITYVNIAATITCVDEATRKKIEPYSVNATRRFQMLKEFSKTNASTGLHCMPIIPMITDSQENMEQLCAMASNSKVSYMLPGVLYLRGRTRGEFFDFIRREYPLLYIPLTEMYSKGGAPKQYKESLYKMVNELREKFHLSSSYTKPMKEKMHKKDEYQQLSLFDHL